MATPQPQCDVFISHATEDKEEFVKPLAEELRKRGYCVWYDEISLKWGDDLGSSIDKGISQSKFGIIVLSQNFIKKQWTQRELNGFVSKEVASGKYILPIWHKISKEEVLAFSPTLAAKRAIDSSKGIYYIINQLDNILSSHPTTPPVDRAIDYIRLRDLLAALNWKDADYETYLVMLKLVGRKEGDPIRNEELLNFPCTHLRKIDQLWVKSSKGRFGFSVQKKILESVVKPDGKFDQEAWKKFGEIVGWRKRKWKGWWMNKEEIVYSQVTFDTSAPFGHLPVLDLRGSIGERYYVRGWHWSSLLLHPDL